MGFLSLESGRNGNGQRLFLLQSFARIVDDFSLTRQRRGQPRDTITSRETFKTVVCDLISLSVPRASAPLNSGAEHAPIGQEILHALID
jgi:hypothetical protein